MPHTQLSHAARPAAVRPRPVEIPIAPLQFGRAALCPEGAVGILRCATLSRSGLTVIGCTTRIGPPTDDPYDGPGPLRDQLAGGVSAVFDR